MRNKSLKIRLNQAILMFTALACLLSGCATTSTQNVKFYTLESAVSKPAAKSGKPALYIELLPIKMPEYLKRPQIVTNSKNSAQVNILEQSRWASPFNNELQDALSAAIAQQTNAVTGLHGNQQGNAQAYRLALTLQQLTAYPNDHIAASFAWSLTGLGQDANPNSMVHCQFNAYEEVNSDTAGVVTGMQTVVQKLALQISSAVKDLSNQRVVACES